MAATSILRRLGHCARALAALAVLFCCVPTTSAGAPRPLRLVVMDPLSAPLACACIEGYAQRDYGKLATFLEARLGRPVKLAFGESLKVVIQQTKARPDLIIGARSIVLFDAALVKLPVRPIAMLTGQDGSPNFTGLFVVRAADPARAIADLKGRSILFGPQESAEKHAAALAALEEHRVPVPKQIPMREGCNIAALDVVEKRAAAAVISSYSLALLEGCNTIDKGSLRVVGKTRPVPFISVFAAASVAPADRKAILAALLAVKKAPKLLKALESKRGFVPVKGSGDVGLGWPDWRGPRRDGISPNVPARLPERKRLLWKRPMTGLALSGITATTDYVVLADKVRGKLDVWRCLDAQTGSQLWSLSYPAPAELDYSNSARASPVIHRGLVYLLGAFGHLHCLELATGRIVWKRHVIREFRAKLVQWGMCSSPLVVDQTLVVNPGAKGAALVALDLQTGKTVWTSPGRPSAYSSFILASLGGIRQIVGYDAISLGGWDPKTGRRLWELIPPEEGDFNVPTPVALDGKLLVSTENNGTRLYGFDRQGRILPRPLARNEDLGPDSSTPVVVDGKVFGVWGRCFCLDLGSGLKTAWAAKDDKAYDDHAALIGGNGRVLIATTAGELILLRATAERYELVSRLKLFDEESEVWAHPAIVGSRLYLRNQSAAYCLLLADGH